MLALATGWTDDVIAGLSASFRAACHHVLFLRTLIPDDGLPVIPALSSVREPDQKRAIAQAHLAQSQLREYLFPEDTDV